MTFRVGQKVVCVDDKPDRFGRDVLVKKDDIYTIAHVFDFFGETGVLLDEIDVKRAPGWYAWRFRPVVERKTDISIFTRMLKPQTTVRRLDAVLHDHGFDPPK